MPQTFQGKIEFDEPNTLEDITKTMRYFHEQAKRKFDFKTDWKTKGKYSFKGKGKNSTRNQLGRGNVKCATVVKGEYKKNITTTDKDRFIRPTKEEVERSKGGPIQCWTC